MIALTPLLDERSVRALLDLRARGFDVAVVELSPLAFVEPGSERVEQSRTGSGSSSVTPCARSSSRQVSPLHRGGPRAARGPDSGGDEIQALRQSRARLTLGASAVAGAALLAAFGALTAERLHWLLGGIGCAGVLVLLAALMLRMPALVMPALVLLGGEYAGVFLVRNDTVDVRAPLYGVGLLLLPDSPSRRSNCGGKARAGLLAQRAALLAILALGGVMAGAAVLAAATVPLQGGVALEAVGVVAAVGALVGPRPARGPRPMNLAVVGSLALDRVDGGPPRIGGCPFYAARALRVLGARALVVAKCAAPDRRVLLPPLVRLGLPVRWQDSAATAAFSMAYDGDRRRMTVEAVADPWTPDQVRLPGDTLGARGAPARTTSRPRRSRRSPAVAVSRFDGQGLVRARADRPTRSSTPTYDAALLAHVSILKLAEEEAELLVGGRRRATVWPRSGCRRSLVTLGSRGCVVFADGRARVVRRLAVSARTRRSSGDAFSTAYLVARSRRPCAGLPPRGAPRLVAALLTGRLP